MKNGVVTRLVGLFFCNIGNWVLIEFQTFYFMSFHFVRKMGLVKGGISKGGNKCPIQLYFGKLTRDRKEVS